MGKMLNVVWLKSTKQSKTEFFFSKKLGNQGNKIH